MRDHTGAVVLRETYNLEADRQGLRGLGPEQAFAPLLRLARKRTPWQKMVSWHETTPAALRHLRDLGYL